MKLRGQNLNLSIEDMVEKYTMPSSFNGFENNRSFISRVTDLTPSIIAVYNQQSGKYVYINNSLKALLGYEIDEWMEKGIQFVSSKVHPDDFPRIMRENQKAIEEDQKFSQDSDESRIVEFEYRVLHKNGTYKWLKTYGTVFDRDSLGRVLHVINISLDITAIKETEERLLQLANSLEKKIAERTKNLKESEEKYHSIFASLTEGIVLQDLSGKVLLANPSASRILNASDEQIKINSSKKDLKTVYIHEDGSPLSKDEFPYIQALKTGESQKRRIMGIVKDKGIVWILVNSIPFLDDEGKPYAVASSFEEITEQKKLEKQKDEFISIASHELKTPLTTIKSFTEILKMQFGKEEKAVHYLDKMNGEIDRLTSLVNELLDVSKIQSGGLILNKEKVNIDQFLNEIVEDIQATTEHQIIYREKASGKVVMDKYRIYQVLINLTANAIKYSPKANKVIISTEKVGGKIIFSVKDFGIGITKRDKKRIFDPFFQANTTIRQSHSGLGLGLHIAREIVNRHGGEISVYSKKGVGSLFKFYLPVAEAKNEK